jgi:excisionase family DNA binding protein
MSTVVQVDGKPVGGTMLLTPEETADELRISRTRVYDLIKHDELVSVMIGGSRRVLRASLEDYVRRLVAEQCKDAPAA